MHIKAREIKPGMVVRKLNATIKDDVALITAKKGLVEVKLTYFSNLDSYYGRVISTVKGTEKFKVVKGKKRKKILNNIIESNFKRLHDINNDIELLQLIKTMLNP